MFVLPPFESPHWGYAANCGPAGLRGLESPEFLLEVGKVARLRKAVLSQGHVALVEKVARFIQVLLHFQASGPLPRVQFTAIFLQVVGNLQSCRSGKLPCLLTSFVLQASGNRQPESGVFYRLFPQALPETSLLLNLQQVAFGSPTTPVEKLVSTLLNSNSNLIDCL
jgi:hypothetical protein